ncbi:MAG: aminotransferase class IV [Patescibacteria group bacterium]|nr:aminotransferase class IV [bacterium]MDZ4227450.1 aminotransferase class IV [Patescibacteria group bacterium]
MKSHAGFAYFSKNGELLPDAEAVVPLSDIAYSYGFGVYESIRVVAGIPYFMADHAKRLLASAEILGLEHTLTQEFVESTVRALIEKNAVNDCNVKVLLVGAKRAEDATLYIQCLNPLFPDKKLYRDGVRCISVEYERIFPHAKSLSMLRSYLAYRDAKNAGAYDALLVDGEGCIREGTRTNFFCIKDKTLYSPPEGKILLGVTRKAVLKVAAEEGFAIEERDIKYTDISAYDGAFLTSTSSKILPIRSVDDTTLPPQPDTLRQLMEAFGRFFDKCAGNL